MALSHATHKVISLPMFRKDLGVSCGRLLGSLAFSHGAMATGSGGGGGSGRGVGQGEDSVR